MRQEEFEYVKEWVEKTTRYDFTCSETSFDDDGCYFFCYLGNDTLSLMVRNDHSSELWLLRNGEDDLELYSTTQPNNDMCVSIFRFMVHNN